jgi:hypothetical protein
VLGSIPPVLGSIPANRDETHPQHNNHQYPQTMEDGRFPRKDADFNMYNEEPYLVANAARLEVTRSKL